MSRPAFSRLNDWITSSVINARLHEKPEFSVVIKNLQKLIDEHKVPPMAVHMLAEDPAVVREASVYQFNVNLEREIIAVIVSACKKDFCQSIRAETEKFEKSEKPVKPVQEQAEKAVQEQPVKLAPIFLPNNGESKKEPVDLSIKRRSADWSETSEQEEDEQDDDFEDNDELQAATSNSNELQAKPTPNKKYKPTGKPRGRPPKTKT